MLICDNDEGYDALEVAKGLGADACFHKPVEPKALLDSVSTFLSS
jgi:DNA-binding response OmpR family regulator